MEVVELPRPVPKAGEVLVRIHATALNASDWELLTGEPLYGRLWGFFEPRIQVLGSDVSGTVEAVGPGVTRFVAGDEVFGDAFGCWGGFAEWASIREHMLAPKPPSMSFEQAAAIPQSGLIALQALRDRWTVQSGQRVLINGAGGGGGSFALQLAKHLGAEVTGVDSAEKLELMRALGADRVVDYAREDCTRLGLRFHWILDLAGHHSIGAYRRALAPGGRYLLVGGDMRSILGALVVGGLVSLVSGKRMGLLFHRPNHGLDAMVELFGSGALVPVIDRIFPLPKTAEALRYLGDGHAKGKVVISVRPTPEQPGGADPGADRPAAEGASGVA
jgi:NADPH:quinone reductase-like Zn-dependent oxidoreductase